MKTISRTKRLVSMALAMAMVLALLLCAAPTALAAGIDPAGPSDRTQTITNPKDTEEEVTEENSVEIPVLAYTGGDATVYSVDVEWGTMTFVYVSATWNPDTLKHDGEPLWLIYDWQTDTPYSEGVTKTETNAITVTNNSNAEVQATLSYESTADYAGITGTFDGESTGNVRATYDESYDRISLETADNSVDPETPGEAAKYTVYFMPGGAPSGTELPDADNMFATIGNITVTVTIP